MTTTTVCTTERFSETNHFFVDDDAMFVPGMEVEFEGSYKMGAYTDKVGVIKEMSGNLCTVIITRNKNGGSERGAPFQINVTYLEPVPPEKKDKLFVIKGEKKGQRGTLVGIDGTSHEAIVKLDQGGEIVVLKMDTVAKIVDDV